MPKRGRRKSDSGAGPDQILLVGVGNRMRRDDGAGLAAAEAVERLGLPGVSVVLVEGECYRLVELLSGAERVYVVDAARASKPGAIYRFDARMQELPLELFGASSHSFGVVHAVELARVLGRLPNQVIVYGVAGRDFSLGEGMSPEVAGALPELIETLRRELAAETCATA